MPERERDGVPIADECVGHTLAAMKNSPQQSHSERPSTELPPTDCGHHIVTFYEDFDGALRAQRAFDAIAQHFSPDRPTHASSWSFTMLGMPDLNAAIVLDATLADVVVVAAKGDRPLPPRIAAWVEMCMNHGERATPAVVALHADGLEPEGAAAPLCSSLEGIAGRQGATFLCGRDLPGCGEGELPVDRFDDDARIPIRVAATASLPKALCHRWWGIND